LSFAQGTDGPSAQRAARTRIFDREDYAAITLMTYVFPDSVANRLEFGGQVCRRPDGRFEWGRIVVGNPGSVEMESISNCARTGVRSAYFHTHWPTFVPGNATDTV
jgi:hypothetical protein